MPEFLVSQPIQTTTPTVEVTVTAAKPLPVGRQRFRLSVTDDSGNQSRPDEVEVIVADHEAPTAVLTAPRVVLFGKSFTLLGDKSFDAGGGKIVSYAWTYLGPAA